GGGDESGWVYFDNKWLDGRKTDGWGRYTRRRKWMRDAELVEISPDEEQDEGATQSVEGAWDKLRRQGKKETEGPPHSRGGSIDRSASASAAEDTTSSHHLLTPSRTNFTSATSPASTSTPVTTPKSRKKSTASAWLDNHRPSSDSSGASTNNNTNSRHRALSKTSLHSVDAASSSITGDTSSSTRERRATGGERDSPEDDRHTPLHYRQTDWDRSINEGVAEGLS
ncbi:hypothetical protein KC352_g45299, partial [Hortaea werneckii]